MTDFRHGVRRAAWLAVLFAAAAILGSAAAQENLGRGRVTGSVVDESGALIEGAIVVAESLQGTARLEGKSDRKGNFTIAGFGTGTWRFTISKTGYRATTIDQEVRQLKSNTPIQAVIKKLTGLAAFQADARGQELLTKGNTLFDEERYDEAIQVFEEFKAAYREVYQVQINIASSYARKGDAERAESEYKAVLETIARTHGGYSEDKTTAYKAVLETIARTHGGYSEDKTTAVRALSGLGEICLSRKDFEGGREYFREALALSPEDEAAAYNVGEIFFSNQQIDEAIRYFELAIHIRKNWPKPYHKLGLVYLNRGDFGKSLEYFRKFVDIDPESPEVAAVKNIMAEIEKVKK